MAIKKSKGLKKLEKKVRGAQFRGGRKAESIGRMIERLKDKFPLEQDSAGEWLHYARVLKTTAEVLEVQALNALDPARLKGLKEAMVSRAKAKSAAAGRLNVMASEIAEDEED
jgi:hypothetical protein